ncbi:bifunctional phosphoribosylaminoimidazolecarboxamide formyltransferase/IMP cyclohydrolase [Pigmentibacter sp. JX0631]|uniref:bifunctional phosphoribosylaminoimidazolecarboxamide formyltransferase/IMP cyclohydrolase n=1 Tax=Pigmentibacter sp. JX0631 TaxID=2976982 RepID=UPI0024695A1A|nr:bifunctional phosphoribosylaminoimidazolecarboxamide formyltransferase/IMP cyclohydrolase [Pigmentibacter sp. JX0631]WGL60953.1 bifunctional phosphoribosylaminoimidazolecarboxamide formyltransferase/IMP cyclohydrolase [Pigmentibacter sp. JX0631]
MSIQVVQVKIEDHITVKRILLSLSDKTGLLEICKAFSKIDCELYATSSTYKAIKELGYSCQRIENITEFPEILGGRVKTLHPKIFGGILGRPALESDFGDMQKHGILPFDVVICNLYPFQSAVEKVSSEAELIENIDIGGVSLLRAAAKNHASVSILCDVRDYHPFLQELEKNNGKISYEFRKKLALKAFKETAAYDQTIANALEKKFELKNNLDNKNGPIRETNVLNIDHIPDSVTLSLKKEKTLRYGENPHQKAALYSFSDINEHKYSCLTNMECFHGKELSYNNVLDIEHAIRLAYEFKTKKAAVILKHNTPCGVGVSHSSIYQAYVDAFNSDPVSPFGGIVCLTDTVSEELANKMSEIFLEVIIAPNFTNEALIVLQKKKNLRLVKFNFELPLASKTIFTQVQGGFLAQSSNESVLNLNSVTYPTIVKPSNEIMDSLIIGMTVVKHVRSNAIVLANSRQTLSIAGGFTNRVDAVEHCLNKTRLSLDNAILASDAFFPFPDSIDLIHKAGIKYIIQPGGSVQDSEVIKACDNYGIAMVFTGVRHFKH